MSAGKRLKTKKAGNDEVILLKDTNEECLPIKSLQELKNWNPSMTNHASAPLLKRVSIGNHPKTLICHDMKGGYLEDRFTNGSNTENNYYFLHWAGIDVFVYFSHHLVTIPPCGWISAAHRNGVQVLGTFITEWEDGVKICEAIFRDDNEVQQLCTQLVQIAYCYNFDGWLINIENKLQVCQIHFLKMFVQTLTKMMHSYKPGSLVIWYDSVLESGDLKWQNALNEHNRLFFDSCDGIFLNYNWTEETLKQSVKEAGERKTDIFVGVDVFGRGCPGGGGFSTNIAVAAARDFGLSIAIFAPGWIHESLDIKDFKENLHKFWNALQKFCLPRIISSLPYSSSFCPGFGTVLFKNGKILSDEPWFNLSLQQPQPIFYSDYSSDEASISTFNKVAFNGGGCICLKTERQSSTLSSKSENVVLPHDREVSTFKILKTSIPLKENIIVTYAFKSLLKHVDVALVLHMCSFPNNYDIHLIEDKYNNKEICSPFLLPLSKDKTKLADYSMQELTTSIQGWVKRSYKVHSSNFLNGIIKDISVKVIGPKHLSSCVLLGELKILPLCPTIRFTYKDLSCQYNEENKIVVKCTLQWSYHPSAFYSDLFLLVNDKKTHICRTSQFYYNFKCLLEIAVDFDILLSIQKHDNEYFPNMFLKIPVKIS